MLHSTRESKGARLSYATGYSKAAMQGAIENLQMLMQYDMEYS